MRLTTVIVCVSLLITACSRKEEDSRSSLEQAQEKMQDKLNEGAAQAKKALASVKERWDEFRPEAEKALESLEHRVEELVSDSEALKRLPPDALEKARAHLDAMRRKLAEAKAAYERGDADLAVEKADDVQQEQAAVEELLVERPDPAR